jgi:hypothetical protein
MSKYQQIDLNKIERCSIQNRSRKTELQHFAKPLSENSGFSQYLDSLPACLKALDFKELLISIRKAREKKKPIIFMLGAHMIKCGLSPLMIDLMKNRFVTFLATHGAGVIHDIEISFWGKTSEEVEKNLADGSFGMSKETSDFFNGVSAYAFQNDLGLGEALGKKISESAAKFKKHSLFSNAYQLGIPATVHMAIGTDILNQHPGFNGAKVGHTSFTDFKILCNEVSKIKNGGVVINFGSAVILPEVFLKALSVARNIRGRIDNFTTANFDMIQHYRPNENVVKRPIRSANSGKGYSFTGHHELMFPLLAWGLKSTLRKKRKS